jgi:hypothetical protein
VMASVITTKATIEGPCRNGLLPKIQASQSIPPILA